jgi:hypothetical protein
MYPKRIGFSNTLRVSQTESTFCPLSPDFRKIIAFFKVPRLGPFVLSVRATSIRRWVWSNGGMIKTGQNLSLGEKAVPLPVFTPQIL